VGFDVELLGLLQRIAANVDQTQEQLRARFSGTPDAGVSDVLTGVGRHGAR
jgi:hypothetical protein